MQVMVVAHAEPYAGALRGGGPRPQGGKPRLESTSDIPADGLLVHVAAQTDDGFMILDVFESHEAFDPFGALASPIATEEGIEEPPDACGCTPTSLPDGPGAG